MGGGRDERALSCERLIPAVEPSRSPRIGRLFFWRRGRVLASADGRDRRPGLLSGLFFGSGAKNLLPSQPGATEIRHPTRFPHVVRMRTPLKFPWRRLTSSPQADDVGEIPTRTSALDAAPGQVPGHESLIDFLWTDVARNRPCSTEFSHFAGAGTRGHAPVLETSAPAHCS